MLDMIRNSISDAPEAAALFYDELARIIQLGGIDPKIEVQVYTVKPWLLLKATKRPLLSVLLMEVSIFISNLI